MNLFDIYLLNKYIIFTISSNKDNTLEEAVLTMSEDVSMINNNKFTTNTWIVDTGATSHMTNSNKGLANV